MKTHDPIVAEVRAIRDKHASEHDYDVDKIFRSIKAQQESSSRKYVRLPARLVKQITDPGG